MEELVGKLWHRLVTRAADDRFPDAAVSLAAIRPAAGVMFRALGGNGALRLEAATATAHRARRRWLQRIAGSGREVELAWRDGETLRLPAVIALFPERRLNRELYLWLAALAAVAPEGQAQDWLVSNQAAVTVLLQRFPGLRSRYRELVAAHLALRPSPDALPDDEAAAERAIRAALNERGTITSLPIDARQVHPVPLWLHPAPPLTPSVAGHAGDDEDDDGHEGHSRDARNDRRRRAERVDMPDGKDGLVAARLESIFSWAEYVKVDRTTDEDDGEDAERTADDMDVMSVARDGRAIANKVRFDLDLPAADHDDLPLSGPIALPEWDYRRGILLPRHCLVQPLVARDAHPCELPPHLRRLARRVRSQFEALAQSRRWLRAQPEGNEPDLDAWLHFTADRLAGRDTADQGLYRSLRVHERNMACLLLADLSLSTDAAVDDTARVIDVIRDSLFLFAEALSTAGDRLGIYGFSSRRRQHVRFHAIKGFAETYGAAVRGRIAAIRPGYYTRMGAAIRHASDLLATQAAERRLLLILTDGKPNDLDRYEGRYGIEDTREAVREARHRGLFPFCITIDREAAGYLPHMFGADGFAIIRRPQDLPTRLPHLYARLTGSAS
ncbi:MAG: nitric oxide reductase activation protein NorD [Thiohalomonadaceae bacterium]